MKKSVKSVCKKREKGMKSVKKRMQKMKISWHDVVIPMT